MGLRLQDPIPEWVTHIALVQGGRVETGERATILKELDSHTLEAARSAASVHAPGLKKEVEVLVDMQNVNVRYHERHVSYSSSPGLGCFSYLFDTGTQRYQLDYSRRRSLASPRCKW
jgi:hypothetical protein